MSWNEQEELPLDRIPHVSKIGPAVIRVWNLKLGIEHSGANKDNRVDLRAMLFFCSQKEIHPKEWPPGLSLLAEKIWTEAQLKETFKGWGSNGESASPAPSEASTTATLETTATVTESSPPEISPTKKTKSKGTKKAKGSKKTRSVTVPDAQTTSAPTPQDPPSPPFVVPYDSLPKETEAIQKSRQKREGRDVGEYVQEGLHFLRCKETFDHGRAEFRPRWEKQPKDKDRKVSGRTQKEYETLRLNFVGKKFNEWCIDENVYETNAEKAFLRRCAILARNFCDLDSKGHAVLSKETKTRLQAVGFSKAHLVGSTFPQQARKILFEGLDVGGEIQPLEEIPKRLLEEICARENAKKNQQTPKQASYKDIVKLADKLRVPFLELKSQDPEALEELKDEDKQKVFLTRDLCADIVKLIDNRFSQEG